LHSRALRAALIAALAAAALAFGASTAGAAAESFTSVSSTAFHLPVWDASHCLGEIVVVDGVETALVHVTVRPDGTDSVRWEFVPSAVSAYGVVSGYHWLATGVSGQSFTNDFTPPFTQTYVSTFHLIGQGPYPNLDVTVLGHGTVLADGTVTSAVDGYNVSCAQSAT
jgi:hypothetical protein